MPDWSLRFTKETRTGLEPCELKGTRLGRLYSECGSSLYRPSRVVNWVLISFISFPPPSVAILESSVHPALSARITPTAQAPSRGSRSSLPPPHAPAPSFWPLPPASRPRGGRRGEGAGLFTARLRRRAHLARSTRRGVRRLLPPPPRDLGAAQVFWCGACGGRRAGGGVDGLAGLSRLAEAAPGLRSAALRETRDGLLSCLGPCPERSRDL